MGVYYQALINKMKADFKESSSNDLEMFLKENKEAYQSEFRMPNVLMLMNICKLLKNEGVQSEHFNKEFEREFNETEA